MELTLELRSVIEEVVCPDHGLHPQVVTKSDNSIELICCCPEFKVQCFHLLKKLWSNQQNNKDNVTG